jgi:hypothetical protein
LHAHPRLLLLLVAAAAVGAAALAYSWYRTPLTLPATPYDFEVKSGATLSAVARAPARAAACCRIRSRW